MTFHRISADEPQQPSHNSRYLLNYRLGRSQANPILFHSIRILHSRRRCRTTGTTGRQWNRNGTLALHSENFVIPSSISVCVEVSCPVALRLWESLARWTPDGFRHLKASIRYLVKMISWNVLFQCSACHSWRFCLETVVASGWVNRSSPKWDIDFLLWIWLVCRDEKTNDSS